MQHAEEIELSEMIAEPEVQVKTWWMDLLIGSSNQKSLSMYHVEEIKPLTMINELGVRVAVTGRLAD